MSTSAKATSKTVCVIGAGITGLVSAAILAEQGLSVILLESSPYAGGLLSTFAIGQTKLEYLYHHIFTSDHEAIQLLKDLSLEDSLHWYTPQEALFAGNKNYPFSTPIDLMRFQELPWQQRLQTGLAVLRAGRLHDWKQLENMTAAEWLIAACGQQAYEKLWEPLLRAKFDQDAKKISAVWIWNKFKLRGSSRSKLGQKGKLGYLDNSFDALINKLSEKIMDKGGRICFGYTVMDICRNVSANNYSISCVLEDCSSLNFEADAIIATNATEQFAQISYGLNLPLDYRQKLKAVKYKANVCLILRLKRRLSTYYWNTICDVMPFVVMVEHTNMVSDLDYKGYIIYLSRYLDVSDPMWTQTDNIIYHIFLEALEDLYSDFTQADIIDWRIKRSRYAQPVIEKNYSQILPNIDTPAAGVKLAGMAQIYPEDRGINYAIKLAKKASISVLDYLNQ